MEKWRKFTASVSIVEQPNGYFTVHGASGGFGDVAAQRTTYPNLTWTEVLTLFGALQSEWSDLRPSLDPVWQPEEWDQMRLPI